MDLDLPGAATAMKSAFDLLRSALGAMKDAKELLPDSSDKAAIGQTLEEAEKASQLAEAQLAKALGYNLCQCTFPPQIMLSKGYDNIGVELFQCPACGKEYPPEVPEEASYFEPDY